MGGQLEIQLGKYTGTVGRGGQQKPPCHTEEAAWTAICSSHLLATTGPASVHRYPEAQSQEEVSSGSTSEICAHFHSLGRGDTGPYSLFSAKYFGFFFFFVCLLSLKTQRNESYINIGSICKTKNIMVSTHYAWFEETILHMSHNYISMH